MDHLTDDELREQIRIAAETWYQSGSWKSRFARETGIARTTVMRWFTETRPPNWPLLLLQSWTAQRDQSRDLAREINAALQRHGH